MGANLAPRVANLFLLRMKTVNEEAVILKVYLCYGSDLLTLPADNLNFDRPVASL